MRQDRLLALLFVLLPLAGWPGVTGSAAPKYLILGLGAASLLMIRAVSAWRGDGRIPRLRSLRLLSIVLLTLLVLLNSMRLSANRLLSAGVLILIACWLVIAIETALVARDPGRRRGLLWALVAGAAVVASISLMQIAGLAPPNVPGEYAAIGGSQLGNRNFVAAYLAALFLPSMLLLPRSRAGFGKRGWAAVLLLAIAAAAIIACRALGPVLALAAAAGIVTAVHGLTRRRRPRGAATVFVAGTLAVFLVWGAGSCLYFKHLTDPEAGALPGARQVTENAGRVRIANWYYCTRMLADHPVAGVGPGAYRLAWPYYRAAAAAGRGGVFGTFTYKSGQAHNESLQFAAETGLPGLLLMAGAMILLLGTAWRRIARAPDDPEFRDRLLIAGGLLTLAFHALVSFPFHQPAAALAAAYLAGVLAAPAFELKTPSRRAAVATSAICAGLALLIGGVAVREFRADLFEARGIAAYRADDFTTAVDLLERSKRNRIWPRNGDFYLGLAHSALDEPAAAMSAFEASLRSAPSFRTYLHLAEIEIEAGRLSSGLRYLDFLKDLHPEFNTRRDGLYLRGRVALLRKDPEAARVHWERILEDDPRYHRAMIGLGYLDLLGGDAQRARIRYMEARRLIRAKIQDPPGGRDAVSPRRYVRDLSVVDRALADLDARDRRPR